MDEHPKADTEMMSTAKINERRKRFETASVTVENGSDDEKTNVSVVDTESEFVRQRKDLPCSVQGCQAMGQTGAPARSGRGPSR